MDVTQRTSPTASALLKTFALLMATALTACGELPAPRHTNASTDRLATSGRTAGTSGPDAMASAGSIKKDADKNEADDSDDPQEKVTALRDAGADAQADLEESQIELQIAELRAKRERHEEELALQDAERKLTEAKAKLKHFLEVERTHRQAEASLRLDRATEWADQAAMELKELEAMYAEEEFASMTKELVLRRGKKSQEFAARDLANQRMSNEALRGFELPKEQRELEHAVTEATRGVTEAKSDLTLGDLDRGLTLLRARREVRDLEKKVKDLRAKLAKAEKEAASSKDA